MLLLKMSSHFQVALGFPCVLICGLGGKMFNLLSYFIALSFMKEVPFHEEILAHLIQFVYFGNRDKASTVPAASYVRFIL